MANSDRASAVSWFHLAPSLAYRGKAPSSCVATTVGPRNWMQGTWALLFTDTMGPTFFVIAAACLQHASDLSVLEHWIQNCLEKANINTDQGLWVRSSGTTETLDQRGRLKSTRCDAGSVVSTIQGLTSWLPPLCGGQVHWIVQQVVAPINKGHLSNVRRLSCEGRDSVAKFEPTEQRVISQSRDLPNEQTYRRPDLRHVDDNEVEKLITFELTANRIEETKQTFKFSMLVQREVEKKFALNLPLSRSGVTLRGVISLRLDPEHFDFNGQDNSQLPFKF